MFMINRLFGDLLLVAALLNYINTGIIYCVL